MDIKKLLGARIKEIRKSENLTQEKLAEMLNISQRALSSIETCDNFITSNTLNNLLKTLNLTPNELFECEQFGQKDDLVKTIVAEIKNFSDNEEKLRLIYKLIKAVK